MFKACSQCGDELPLAEFGVDTRNRDGRRSACRDCECADEQARKHGGITPGRIVRHPIPVCTCDPARAGGSCGACLGCGLPIVKLMFGQALCKASSAFPHLLEQRIERP